ncbi:MAG: HD domain-containing protein, partial [Planctomycetes bacterium]|nr:HD domain-containing protein [Planctomycetota bacterium]
MTVARYAEEIGRRVELKPSTIGALRVAAMLHDIGKIGVPDSILAKPGPLSTEEYTVIKRHPRTALKILEHVSFLERELPIILHHHEWFNGTGYPDGLAGEQIPIGARVLAAA